MVSRLFSLFTACLLYIFSFNLFAASQVIASIDKNPATIDESITLTITVDDTVSASKLDLSALQQDFTVLNTSVSTQTSIINSDMTRTTRFTTLIIPKRVGKITIPAIKIAGQQSAPIALSVVKGNAANQQSNKNVFIETTVSNNTVWLNQQLNYTTKIYLAESLSLGSNSSLSQPELAGATIEQRGEGTNFQTIINGKRYNVIQRDFLVSPQQSGELEIKSPIFQGEIILGNNRRSVFSQPRSKVVKRVGDKITINVKDIPKTYQGHWLPSDFVTLHEEITPMDQFVVGEPITRTINLTAIGVSGDLLPELNINYPDTMKVYPDKAETHTKSRGDDIIAQRIESAAIIPNQAGKILLPEIKVTWWNTQFEKMDTAIIPARQLTVMPAQTTTTTAIQNAMPSNNVTAPMPADIITKEVTKPWGWNHISSILAGLLTISFLINMAYFYSLKSKAKKHVIELDHSVGEKIAWQKLSKALKKSDRKATQQHLAPWVCALYQDDTVATFHQAMLKIHIQSVTEELETMQASAFSIEKLNWNGEKLQQALNTLRSDMLIQQTNPSALQPLNP